MTNPSDVAVPSGAQLWLTQRRAAAIDAEPLTGDLSTRRYFRLRLAEGGSSILALYPTGDSACQRFRRSDAILAQAGIRTPRIRAYDCGADWMLLEDVGPEDLTIDRLLKRMDDPSSNSGGVAVKELILGLNPTLEGDGTALLLSEEAHKRGVRVTRLARGLPAGSQLEYANKAVLADAIAGRQPMD